MTTSGDGAAPLRLLIDANFYITLEPYGGALERGQAVAAEVVRLAAEQRHRLFVHPATRDDLLETTDPSLRAQRLAELQKFPVLLEGPIPAALTDVLGVPNAGSNNDRDLRLLAALHQGAVTYLISDDRRLRRRAARVGLADRVLGRDDAAALLRQLSPTVPSPPPRVRLIPSYTLDTEQAIFVSLRADYPRFDEWLAKVRQDADNRDCYLVEDDDRYAALAIVKRTEDDCEHRFLTPVSKLSMFKVDIDFLGSKYGELLLKAVFRAAHDRNTASIYVEVFPHHDGLIDLLGRFGFNDSGARTSGGELVLVKRLRPDGTATSPLEHHIRFGPPAIHGAGQVFVVPIIPLWHRQLFPDAPGQQLELLSPHPWGNALRKAYLSNGNTTLLRGGDTLLFYQSHGPAEVTAVGVVEATLRSADPVAVMNFVAGRTVYSDHDVAAMCQRGKRVLATLFRQDRFIEPAWTFEELRAQRVLNGRPQSITRVQRAGATWVHEQLAG